MIKNVYFVRHGQTEANRTRIHQNADEELTVKGRLQAHHVAQVLATKQIEALLSSPYRRARETASIISDHIHVPFIVEESVVEIRRPDHIYGQTYYSFDTLVYFFRLFKDREHPRWDYGGAENMFALRNRIEDIKGIIAQMDEKTIAIVSHDVFMNLFLEHVCKQNKLNLKEFLQVITKVKRTPNTGVIHLTYDADAPKGTCPWSLQGFINPSTTSKT
jgi:broad specificity phosphatase PhoE